MLTRYHLVDFKSPNLNWCIDWWLVDVFNSNCSWFFMFCDCWSCIEQAWPITGPVVSLGAEPVVWHHTALWRSTYWSLTVGVLSWWSFYFRINAGDVHWMLLWLNFQLQLSSWNITFVLIKSEILKPSAPSQHFYHSGLKTFWRYSRSIPSRYSIIILQHVCNVLQLVWESIQDGYKYCLSHWRWSAARNFGLLNTIQSFLQLKCC